MRGILCIAVVLLASMAFAATDVSFYDISDVGGVNGGETVFPSLSDASTLIFDNSAVLSFSTAPYPTGNASVNFPLANSYLTIHSLALSFDPDVPVLGQNFAIGDVPNTYYTNTQGSADDPASNAFFPYNIPRPQRDCAQDFTAVYFQLARPATQFGVYLPCGSNNWGDPNGPYDDSNYQFLVGKWTNVYVMHAGDTFLTAEHFQLSLTGYCPFVMVDDPAGIMGVVITDNCFVNAGPTFGFMDVYATMSAALPQPHPGDANNDGAVDVVDLGILARNYDWVGIPELPIIAFGRGDFNDDGKVDVIDLGTLARNYDWTGAPAGAVPEPMTLSLLAVGAAALIRRKR